MGDHPSCARLRQLWLYDWASIIKKYMTIENDWTVLDNKRKSMQIFDLFSDLHQARMRGRGRGKWRERGEDEEGKEAKLEK